MKSNKKNVIFELTVENIPARFIIPAKEQLKNNLLTLLKEKQLPFGDVKVYATYRRFVAFITDVPAKTEKTVEKIYGPKASLLKDDYGNFTPAAVGFARSCGVNPQDLQVENHEKKGALLCVVRTRPSVSCIKILSEVFSRSIRNLDFPKNMIWEESRFRFARPIRNIVALWGSKIIPVSICGVKSGRVTFSSYFTGFKRIVIKSADSYFLQLDRNYVIVDDNEREKRIVAALEGIERTLGLISDRDESVIKENVYLCEYPRSVVVKYPSDFLKLPYPLLELVIKKQLKFFPLREKNGNLAPFFVGIRDGTSKGQSNVESGYLNVMKARCADALFFYETDLKTDPSVWKEKLKKIIFQGNLGSVYDKTLRVKEIVKNISQKINCDADVVKASEYIYFDLASNVVGEFAELEGLMNYYYAKNYGIEDEKLKKAISQIYLPISISSAIPSDLCSCVMAIAHKIDSLVGDFLVGIIPTGSNDPHGLRRSAIGIFRILLEMKINLSIRDLISWAYELYPQNLKSSKSYEKLTSEILEFIYQRALSYFEEKKIDVDVVNSVEEIFLREGDVVKFKKRIDCLMLMKQDSNFKKLVFIYKRLKNITMNWDKVCVDESFFKTEEEKNLFKFSIELEKDVYRHISNMDFLSAIKRIISLNDILEVFFEKVFVMADDNRLRENRLSILKKVYNLFSDIADISKIVG
ncbi:MAG: glycine--tRNA ligase subunit beta [Elusimicrobiales bacterium]